MNTYILEYNDGSTKEVHAYRECEAIWYNQRPGKVIMNIREVK